MKFEREAGIHVHATVLGRQGAPGRYLIDVLDREPRVEVLWHAVIVAVRDGNEVHPAAPLVGRVSVIDLAALIDGALHWNPEIVRGDCGQFHLELVRRVKGGAAEHNRHTAGDRSTAG